MVHSYGRESTSGDTDPSVGIGADGTVYFGYADGDGHARVAVPHDRGATWQHVQDVGAAQGVQNTVFPAVVGGDSDRAAFFFLGSTTPGANGRATDRSFSGTWFGYIATTFDGGVTWVTANATANDPVQCGVVCTNGTKRRGHFGYIIIARGHDPNYLDSYSVKKGDQEEID